MPNDQYQLGELLGRGGMGQVHAGRHRSGRLVAIKRVRNTLSADRLIVDRLADEARLLCAISHPNVVRAFDHGTGTDGLPFLVMERAHGTPLHQLIADHGLLPLERVAVIASQLFAGLAAIHEARIVHADLKSHNVLVDEVDIVTIIDLGLARTVAQDPATVGLVAGTPAYMAPEIIAGEHPTFAGDVYAAAAIIYEMLTGTTPFSGHISTILTRQLSEAVEPPSHRAPRRGISAAVDRAVLRALHASPVARFSSVAAFADAFLPALTGQPAPERESELAVGSDFWLDQPTIRRVPTPALSRIVHVDERTDSLICAALAHAQRLIEDHRVAQAVQALEATLGALAPTAGDSSCTDAWRIETVLAALYVTLGKQERGRRMALVAYRHALRSGCPLAEDRAAALVDRLVNRPVARPRLARGSVRGER
jgi:serine/threonine protein kinase